MSEMAPQPPPDTHTPLPDVGLPPIRWRLWIWSGMVLLAITSLSLIEGIYFCRDFYVKGRSQDVRNAISNIRQIGLALAMFDTEYGKFPDADTISKVPNDPADPIPLGDKTSNDFFRQLIASKNAETEQMFYAWNPSVNRRPDDRCTGKLALEKGECAFAYVVGLSAAADPNTPVVLFPLVPGKKLFDYSLCKDAYAGQAVIWFRDLRVQQLPVDKTGQVYLNGKDLFDPSQPFWCGKVPDVKWPE